MNLLIALWVGALLTVFAAPAAEAALPDSLENNWSPATAPTIALDVAYDLTLVCPVDDGCPGGDHDYLRLPVKRGLEYRIATYDLSVGVDTVMDLYWGDVLTPTLSSDDLRPETAQLSAVVWRAPSDGDAIVRIAPRTGGATPSAPGYSGAYRLMAALTTSAAGARLAALLDAQTGIAPPPGPAAPGPNASDPSSGGAASPSAAPAPGLSAPPDAKPLGADTSPASSGAAPTIVSDGVTAGAAHLREPAQFYDDPQASVTLEQLDAGTEVEMLGRAAGRYLLVKPRGGLRPGWVAYDVIAADAAPHRDAAPLAAAGAPSQMLEPGAAITAGPVAATTLPRIARLPDAAATAPPALPTTLSRIPLLVRQRDGTPLARVRVQLIDPLGATIVEAVSGPDGRVTLQGAAADATALLVRLPAFGIDARWDAAAAELIIELPGERGEQP